MLGEGDGLADIMPCGCGLVISGRHFTLYQKQEHFHMFAGQISVFLCLQKDLAANRLT